MMVVRLSSVGARRRVHVALDRSPYEVINDVPDEPWKCKRKILEEFGQDAPTSDVVRSVGAQLLKSLQRHEPVRNAVEAALASQDGCPIYVQLESTEAAEYPWECLFDASRRGFLALKREWPIGRIVPGVHRTTTRYVAPPIRLIAILSAVRVDAAGEWRSIRKAIEDTPLDVRVRVVVGQHSLYNDIKADTPRWVDECVLLSNRRTVSAQIRDFEPHLVHLFCHGTARPTPILELATPQGHAAGRSDVQLTAPMLKPPKPAATWLVTLNSCLGASDAAGVRGLASELVGAGYPAAIGMREPITDTDAHLFSENFYTEAFDRLRDVFEHDHLADPNWALTLCGARDALLGAAAEGLDPEKAAARIRKWTIPILCVGKGSFTVRPVMIHPERGDADDNKDTLDELNILADGAERMALTDAGRTRTNDRIAELIADLRSPPQ